MEIEAKVLDYLKQQHVHFCFPMYGGQCSEVTFMSMIKFIILAQRLGLNYSIDTMVNESLITRGRNNLVAKMLNNKAATHLMFIDSDIHFEPEAILRLLAHDVDFCGAIYPMKTIPAKYVVNVVPNPVVAGDLVEVGTLGTGFMLVKRKVIEMLIQAHPNRKYNDNIGVGKALEPYMYALFDTMIDEDKNYLSEDWTFCYLWRKLGGKIFADTKIKLHHSGYYVYNGSLEELEKVLKNALPNGVKVEEPTITVVQDAAPEEVKEEKPVRKVKRK